MTRFSVVAHPEHLSDAGTRGIAERGHAAWIMESVDGEAVIYQGIDYEGDEDETRCRANLDVALGEAGWRRISDWAIVAEEDDALCARVE